jgi:hypothetical protein
VSARHRERLTGMAYEFIQPDAKVKLTRKWGQLREGQEVTVERRHTDDDPHVLVATANGGHVLVPFRFLQAG